MERYSVVVSDPSSPEPLRLLLPFLPSATCAALVKEIVKRAARHNRTLDTHTCTLHINEEKGPILDLEDILSDVVFGEDVFAVFTLHVATSSELTDIPVRIITPVHAKHSTKDPMTLPPPAFSLLASATIEQLREKAIKHLRGSLPDSMDATSSLDLHLHELPIAPASFCRTLSETGLATSLNDGVLNIYAVIRPASETQAPEPAFRVGMNDLFEAGEHWQPLKRQSDRGVAMFLSSLRVFARLLRGDEVQDDQRNRILYLFDLLCAFPPAVRALYLLIQGQTISHSASAALSQAFYAILEDTTPRELIRDDDARVFEGARLILGLLSEKTKHPKLASSHELPQYIPRFELVQLLAPNTTGPRNPIPVDAHITRQETVSTRQHPQSPEETRWDLLSGARDTVTVFHSQSTLFVQPHRQEEIVTAEEMRDSYSLAVFCGRASLSVFKPSSLSSVAPECLTFDREGHLAVYTGRAICAAPGQDIVIFRPLHGEETPNIGILEQQLAPILQRHEADGTNVFDAVGSSQTRSLETPDEILMFCVDCSASMDCATDLVKEPTSSVKIETEPTPAYSQDAYNRAELDVIKKKLSQHEVYDDIVGAVAETSHLRRADAAEEMLKFLGDLLKDHIDAKRGELSSQRWFQATITSEVDSLETFFAGLCRFKDRLVDMIILQAMGQHQQEWIWQIGDPIPNQTRMSALSNDIVDMPASLRCPISKEVLQDPVTAADGHSYSRESIKDWMKIRKTSPMTGLTLYNTYLQPSPPLSEQASSWIQADDILKVDEKAGSKRRRTSPHTSPHTVNVKFSGASFQFDRDLPPSLSLLDLYKVAFRGMRGRHAVFRLSFGDGLTPSTDTITSHNIREGSIVRIDSGFTQVVANQFANPLCLIKAYTGQGFQFGFWVPRLTDSSMATILAKHWRFNMSNYPYCGYAKKEIWTNLRHYGDNRRLGYLSASREQIRTFLASEHAFGSLASESVEKSEAKTLSRNRRATRASRVDSPLVLKVEIDTCSTQHPNERRFSRLEVLKQMFEAMINRIIAYSYKTHVGLVTVNTTAKVSQSITHVIENFRNSVENMEADGDTALWDGLKLAQGQILQYANKYPQAQLRIICLSDGNDNKSTATPAELCWQLGRNKIAVDSVCIGSDNNLDLNAISRLLGSYSFYPEDLATALAICELEPVLSQTERPPAQPIVPSYHTSASTQFNNARRRAVFTKVTKDVFPERKQHPRIQDSFIQLVDCVRTHSGRSAGLPTLRNSRLLVEMRDIAANPHPKYDCFVSETDMSFWKIVMEGPPDTPYSGSTFLLYLEMPANYPTFAPKGRFVTPIFHPNVNRHGRICHSIFDRDWTTDTTLHSVLDTVYGLLFQAETSDAVHTTVTLGFHHDEAAFAIEARRHAEKHARKTREQWKSELTGDE